MPYITNVYVDAFNLYYGCLKGTPYRWLDLSKLCDCLLINNDVNQIKYFTSHVKARPNDPDQPNRQQFYLRALGTIPNLQVVLGSFITRPRFFPRVDLLPDGSLEYVEVLYTEEKGSDVNLAAHMLYDGFVGDYEMAVIISNDSDLAEPVRIVNKTLGKKVGILNPQINHCRDEHGNIDYKSIQPSRKLNKYVLFNKPITEVALAKSQFPAVLSDGKGTFHKPPSW